YPTGLPILGNLFEFPSSQWWLKFSQWADRYGALVHLRVLGRHILVVNDHVIAQDLLDSSIHADRPRFTMAGELMGFDPSIAFIGYGERWRTYRRIGHPVMSKHAVTKYFTMQEEEAIRLLRALFTSPERYRREVRFSVGRTIMHAMYGIECESPEDTYIVVAEATLENITHAVVPGSFMVDVIPYMKYLPYMGLRFQKKAMEAQRQMKLMVDRPYRQVLRERTAGAAKHSFVSALLDSEIKLPDSAVGEEDDVVSWAAATMYGGTYTRHMSEGKTHQTTQATLLNFILAMTLNRHVLRKAQEEVDTVVGRHRAPSFLDKDSLPYINALIKEVIRWRVPLPLGVPHRCRQDTQYNGFLIREGTIIIPNLWTISHDKNLYDSPNAFLPERFIGKDSLDPDYAFGFGPRTCIGKNFAESQLFIFSACIIWAFDISKDVNEFGDEIDPQIGYTTGFVRCVINFPRNGV
ncbi:cytochrome P450, partial [Stereum hirsutum FP-91666 SS1]